MSKIIRWVLIIVVGTAAYLGVRYLRGEHPLGGQTVDETMAEMRSEAAQKHPKLAKTDALKAVGTEWAQTMLAKIDSPQQREGTAADMFFGFFFINTRARVAYCEQRGVDISPFVTALTTANTAELAKAEAIYRKAGVTPESMWQKIQMQAASVIDQDMKDVTAGAQVRLEDACGLFVEHPDVLAKTIPLNPEIRKALMGAN